MVQDKRNKVTDIFDTIYSLKRKLGTKLLTAKLNELDLLHGDYDEEAVKVLVVNEVEVVPFQT